jgi:hypothetical protein
MPKLVSTKGLSDKDTLNKNLDIPKSMGRYRARKVLILIRRFDRLAVKAPGNVPIDGYLKLLAAFDEALKQIREEENDKRTMGKNGDAGRSPAVGAGDTTSEHSGVSSDNPFAGAGTDTA